MMQELKKRISVKLFLLLAALILLATVPLAYVVFSTVSYFGTYTAEINRKEIKSQAYAYLATIAREQAHNYDKFFSHVEATSSMMAAQAKEVYDNIDYYASFPAAGPELSKNPLNNIYYSDSAEDVITFYWGADDLSRQVLTEVQALARLDQVIKATKNDITESHAAHIITASGVGRYLSYAHYDRDAAFSMPPASDYDLRDSESFAIFTGMDEFTRKVVWTRTFRNATSGTMLTASSPVTDRTGVLRAVTGVDIPVQAVMSQLMEPDTSRYRGQMAETLFAFLCDDEGHLVAFPRQFLHLFGFADDLGRHGSSGNVTAVHLSDSEFAKIRDLTSLLPGLEDQVVELELNNEKFILNMHALHRIDWHLILVTREAELISSVAQTEKALTGTIELLIRKFIGNALIILLGIFVVVFFVVGYFVEPLKKLSEAALRVGRGDLATRCDVEREDELGILAASFNDMVARLESAEKIKGNQAKQLELTVSERTRDLRSKNMVLRDVINELNAESERRKRAVEALRKSEEQLRVIMDGSFAGQGIIQDYKIKYVNPSGLRIFGYRHDEMVGGTLEIDQLVIEGQRQLVRKNLLERFIDRKEKSKVLTCVRKDGTVFEALVGGTVTIWKGKPAVVATIMDISDQKRIEERLRESERRLQSSLAEKEVLLREIYHRTKNNMLVIISMLNLQAMEIGDEKVKNLFQETENRIRAMSLVHEKLYQSRNLTEVDLGRYLEEMVTTLVSNMVLDDRVKVRFELEPANISIDNIVPLGLAVNEIVTNSLKHAFGQNGGGTIFVELKSGSDGLVEVVVGDDGVGLPADIDINRIRSFGMQITANLIRKQLHGVMEILRGKGTVYRIRFTEPQRPKRI